MDLTGFTRCLCTPDMYQPLIKIARILGPLNLMPNAKKGNIVGHREGTMLIFCNHRHCYDGHRPCHAGFAGPDNPGHQAGATLRNNFYRLV